MLIYPFIYLQNIFFSEFCLKENVSHDLISDYRHVDSIKHYDWKPYPKYKPIEFQNYPENKRLLLTKDDFIRDIDLLIDHYLIKLQIVFNVAMYKSFFENEMEIDSPELNDNKLKLEALLSSLLKSIIRFEKSDLWIGKVSVFWNQIAVIVKLFIVVR